MPERGTGETTVQLQQMKPNGLFIWCNDNTDYPRRLATHLGRSDIRVESPDWIDSGEWKGLELSEVVFDHYYFWFAFSQSEALLRKYEILHDSICHSRNECGR